MAAWGGICLCGHQRLSSFLVRGRVGRDLLEFLTFRACRKGSITAQVGAGEVGNVGSLAPEVHHRVVWAMASMVCAGLSSVVCGRAVG